MNMLAFTRKFPRVANQLNYTREFISPNVMKITIPGGIPYESFDNTGLKVTPWSLLQLFESSRAFSFWTVPHAERPTESFFDAHKLLQNNYFFIATANLEINPNLYKVSNPKYPLVIRKELDFVGKSSMNITSYMGHPEMSDPYAICKVQTVLVNSDTRKPIPFPDWWRQKYAATSVRGSASIMKPLPEVDITRTHHCPVTVYNRDTDSYKHTNWASYIKYCSDACSVMVMKNLYKKFYQSTMDNGFKQLEIGFRKESVLGDILDVVSWEDPNKGNTINFKVRKGNDVCAEATMTFFESDASSKL